MKKIVLGSWLLALGSFLFAPAFYAQSKPPATKTAASQPPIKATLTAKDSMICKEWKVTGIEEFSVSNSPNEAQKNDGFSFLLDGTAFLTMEGVNKTGTWTTDKAKTVITVKVEGDTWAHRFKIIELTKTKLFVEFQSVELVRTKYICEPKKK